MIGVRSGIDEYGQPAEEILSGYVGEFKYFGFESVPPHCLACDGSEVSRETYSELFAVFGETFGAGDGATTFNLPDFRGRFLRCVGGNAADLGVLQDDAIRNIVGIINGTFCWSGTSTSGVFEGDHISTYRFTNSAPDGQIIEGWQMRIDSSNTVPTAVENRPINYAVNICVVYE